MLKRIVSMIEIVFLGTGDAFNTDGLANQSLLITSASRRFLVDAGPTCLVQMTGLGLLPEELNFIFITHFHGDHTAGLPFLLLYLQKKRNTAGLPVIIGPTGIKKYCHRLCEAAYRGVGLTKNLTFKEFKPRFKKAVCIDNDFMIDIYPVTHKPESIGYRFYLEDRIVAVSGDAAMDNRLLRLINNADAAIIECSTEKPIYSSHTSLEELARHLPEINAHRIIPVHTTKKIQKKIELLGDEKILLVTDNKKVSI
jgi:ribonuclease BN (tRNA processing enzyme)